MGDPTKGVPWAMLGRFAHPKSDFGLIVGQNRDVAVSWAPWLKSQISILRVLSPRNCDLTSFTLIYTGITPTKPLTLMPVQQRNAHLMPPQAQRRNDRARKVFEDWAGKAEDATVALSEMQALFYPIPIPMPSPSPCQPPLHPKALPNPLPIPRPC